HGPASYPCCSPKTREGGCRSIRPLVKIAVRSLSLVGSLLRSRLLRGGLLRGGLSLGVVCLVRSLLCRSLLRGRLLRRSLLRGLLFRLLVGGGLGGLVLDGDQARQVNGLAVRVDDLDLAESDRE